MAPLEDPPLEELLPLEELPLDEPPLLDELLLDEPPPPLDELLLDELLPLGELPLDEPLLLDEPLMPDEPPLLDVPPLLDEPPPLGESPLDEPPLKVPFDDPSLDDALVVPAPGSLPQPIAATQKRTEVVLVHDPRRRRLWPPRSVRQSISAPSSGRVADSPNVARP